MNFWMNLVTFQHVLNRRYLHCVINSSHTNQALHICYGHIEDVHMTLGMCSNIFQKRMRTYKAGQIPRSESQDTPKKSVLF
jgi:hypothetical protein